MSYMDDHFVTYPEHFGYEKKRRRGLLAKLLRSLIVPEAEVQEKPITVLDLAKYRGATEVNGAINGAEFERVGLPFFGGCEACEASIAAYNAYPSTSGYLRCRDCIGDDGYPTVEAANTAIFGG